MQEKNWSICVQKLLREKKLVFCLNQGDLMSLWKIGQNVAKHIFCSRSIHYFFRSKGVGQKFWLVAFIFEKVSKGNIRPKDENSPNLVTLVSIRKVASAHFFVKTKLKLEHSGYQATSLDNAHPPRKLVFTQSLSPSRKLNRLNLFRQNPNQRNAIPHPKKNSEP
jgi:hypothetical protein